MAHQHREEEGFDKSLPCHVVVDGVPVVDSATVPKLRKVLQKTFSKNASIVDFEMPVGKDGSSQGYVSPCAISRPSKLVHISKRLTRLFLPPNQLLLRRMQLHW
jgi:hypothetical protein